MPNQPYRNRTAVPVSLSSRSCPPYNIAIRPTNVAATVKPVAKREAEVLDAALVPPPTAEVPFELVPWPPLAPVSMVKKVAPMAGPRPSCVRQRES